MEMGDGTTQSHNLQGSVQHRHPQLLHHGVLRCVLPDARLRLRVGLEREVVLELPAGRGSYVGG